jgi:arylsulfatase A-like enzyme
MIVIGNSFSLKRKTVKQPNVILIIADDLGYSDLASYGNDNIHTPYIDALGTSGIRFTRAYVTSPICSPSRMAILTGRYQNRFGCEYMPYEKLDPAFSKDLREHYFSLRKTNPGLQTIRPNLLLNKSKHHSGLPTTEITIAELLKKNGYATGLVGKWNLGAEEGDHPNERGFDYSYCFDGALTRYVDDPIDSSRYVNQHLPWAFSELPAWLPRYGSTAIREQGNIVKDTSYLTFSFANKATEFIEKNKDKPFFLTLAFNAPHDPFQAPKNYFDRIRSVQDSVKRIYYAMIEALDDAVGEVEKKLQATGLEENTIILFISDNGGATYTRATDNAPLRGGKCTHFEGGLMVPFFIKYPALFNAQQVYDKPVSSLDIFSTIAAATNTPLPADRQYDGVNLFSYLTNNTATPHQTLHWRSGYSKAMCKGNWKLYVNEKNNKTFLFDLANDLEEKNDLSKKEPVKLKELQKELQQWEKTETIKPAWPSAAKMIIDVKGEKYYFPG